MRKIICIIHDWGKWKRLLLLSHFLIFSFSQFLIFSFSQPLFAQDQYARHAPTSRRLQHIDTLATHFLLPLNGETEKATVGLAFINTLIEEAYKHLGKRYRSGGKGPTVFDCSGFTGYVFKKFDYLIGASSREQYARNKPIKRSEMRRGDLVFFTSPRSGRGVGHVGIVIDVDPQTDTFTFIHASTNYGVRVTHSTDGYYAKRYIGVRRVF